MLESLVRRLFRTFGVYDLSQESTTNFIRITGLDKLPPHYVFLASSILPAFSLIVKKLRNENIDWGSLELE